MEASTYEVVLFDLGGVLIELGGVGPMRELAGLGSDEELWRRWLTCKWVQAFERGECSEVAFAEGFVEEWEVSVGPEEFLEVFAGWPGGYMDGAVELLEATRHTVPIGCLSNTNALHWKRVGRLWAVDSYFDYRFLSFELGAVKPDPELFSRVADQLPVRPDRVLFLDDNLVNVEGAVAAGFVGAHVRGVREATAALRTAGVLDG